MKKQKAKTKYQLQTQLRTQKHKLLFCANVVSTAFETEATVNTAVTAVKQT